MRIEKDRVATFHYVLSDGEGKALEDTRAGEPMAYLHGHDNIIRGLERELEGRSAGDRFSATIPPELGYGAHRDGAVQRVPMKAVITRGRLRPGMVISVSTERGPRAVRVVKPGRFVVDVDTNHPLAGLTLTFEVEVVAVREASAEEVAHGHVHGAGGHHH